MKLHCIDCPAKIEIRAPEGAKPPRRWRCNWCKRKRSIARQKARTAKRALLTDRSNPYPETDWKTNRKGSLNPYCQCCGLAYVKKAFILGGVLQERRREGIHHIIPKRMAVKFGNPDVTINLLSACDSCHGSLKALDNLILRNDWLGAVAEARRLGSVRYPQFDGDVVTRLQAAAAHFGFDVSNLCKS